MPGWHQLSLMLKMASPLFLAQMNPFLPSAFPLASRDTAKTALAGQPLRSVTAFLLPSHLSFLFTPGVGKSIARSGRQGAPIHLSAMGVTACTGICMLTVCGWGHVCAHVYKSLWAELGVEHMCLLWAPSIWNKRPSVRWHLGCWFWLF